MQLYNPDLWIQLGFNPKYPKLTEALESLFIHTNLLHLLGNMVFLAAVGAAVELAAGSIRFATVYFVGGLSGVFLHFIMLRQVPEPPILVGASGAVASCIAYYTVRYGRLRVPLWPGRGVPVAAITGLWVSLQVAGAMIRLGDADAAVAYWAHLGGFAAGLLLSVLFQAPKMADLELSHEVLREMNERSPGALLAAAHVHLTAHPKDAAGLRQKADALASLGDRDHEADALIELLNRTPESQQSSILERLASIDSLDKLPSLRRTLLAERFKSTDIALAAMLLHSVIEEGPNDPQRPDALVALAGIELAAQPEKARDRLRELAVDHPLHPATELARAKGWL